jgi:hypothetical protein
MKPQKFTLIPHIINLSAQEEIKEIEIINLSGQNIFSKRVAGRIGNLYVKELPPGIYILKISFANRYSFMKFVVVND